MIDHYCIAGVLLLTLLVILFLTPVKQEDPTTDAPEPDHNDGSVEWSRQAMARRQTQKDGPVYGGTDLPDPKLILNEDGELRAEYHGKTTGEAEHDHRRYG